ncbi:MAG: hypothetical protein G3I10_01310 [Ferrovum sp.]|nr:hypothetical protein [Ferrovum sp.]
MNEKATAVAVDDEPETADSLTDSYRRYFSPNADAVKEESAPAATHFKIFSLTNNNVSITYTNGTKI